MFKITIESARVNVGLSRKEAAEKLGINPYTLARYENGIRIPNARMIEKMVELYKMPYDNLTFLRH